MSGKPWHKRYHSDALTGMLALTLEERGAYQTLLDLIYDRQGPIPDNDRLLAGYMGCSLRKWKTLRDRLEILGKIVIRDGEISNPRAEKEIENDAKTSRKHAENGLKGAAVRAENAEKHNENNEDGKATLEPGLSLYQIPEARYSVPNGTGADAPTRDPLKEMFDLGIGLLVDVGQTEKAARSILGKWRQQHGDSRVLEALVDCRNRRISNPIEWMPRRLAAAGRDDPQPNHRQALIEQSRRYANGGSR